MTFKTLSLFASVLILGVILVQTLPSNSLYARKKGRRSGTNLKGTTPLEARFFSDLEAGKASRWSLADAFLIASGFRTKESLRKGQAWIDGLVRQAKQATARAKQTEQKADLLLKWMHNEVFKRYRATSTDALEIMKYGRFNCLSSCILYGVIGYKIGLKVRGIAVDKHAFCRVYQGRKGWDVETTNALGFNPGRKLKLDNRIVSVPRSQYRNRREITLKEMIGLIYSNHMGLTGAFPTLKDQILALQKALYFFPRDPIIQHNLIAAHTQIINQLIDQKSWAYGWAYVQQLKRFEKNKQYWSSLAPQLIQNHLQNLIFQGTHQQNRYNSKRVNQALDQLKRYSQEEPDLGKRLLHYFKASIYESSIRSLSTRSSSGWSTIVEGFEKACISLKKGDQARKNRKVSQQFVSLLRRNELAMLKNQIINQINQQDFERADELITIALRYFPRESDFKGYQRQINRVTTQSRHIDQYNQIVSLVRQNRLLDAIRALNQAQKKDPRSRKLKELRQKIEPTFMYNMIIQAYEDEDYEGVKRKMKLARRTYPRDRALRRLEDELNEELDE